MLLTGEDCCVRQPIGVAPSKHKHQRHCALPCSVHGALLLLSTRTQTHTHHTNHHPSGNNLYVENDREYDPLDRHAPHEARGEGLGGFLFANCLAWLSNGGGSGGDAGCVGGGNGMAAAVAAGVMSQQQQQGPGRPPLAAAAAKGAKTADRHVSV